MTIFFLCVAKSPVFTNAQILSTYVLTNEAGGGNGWIHRTKAHKLHYYGEKLGKPSTSLLQVTAAKSHCWSEASVVQETRTAIVAPILQQKLTFPKKKPIKLRKANFKFIAAKLTLDPIPLGVPPSLPPGPPAAAATAILWWPLLAPPPEPPRPPI